MLFTRFGRSPRFDSHHEKAMLTSYIREASFVEMIGRETMTFDEERFIAEADFTSWQSILEYVFRNKAPEAGRLDTIWGDKTPTYLRNVPLLKELLPEAKFIHIIRDVRDRALSVYKAWGKSLERAASQWADEIENATGYAARYAGDYLEVHYEQLLQNNRDTLLDICRFLGIDFEEDMLSMSSPINYFGNAQGRLDIKSDNLGNYERQMDEETIRRIEEIAYPMMVRYGYQPKYAEQYRTIGRYHLACIGVVDRLRLLWFNISVHGLVKGIRFSFTTWKMDSVKSGNDRDL